MGILDELEQEAARQRKVDGAAPAVDRERLWPDHLGPAVQRLYAYIKQLTANLGFLKKKLRVTYQLPGYGEVVGYIDPNFQLKAVPTQNSVEITLDYAAQLAPEECPMLEVEGVSRVQALNSVFQAHRLSGMQDARKGPNGEIVAARFQARGRVPLSLRISAGQAQGNARMVFVNFGAFGSMSRSYTAEQLDETMFDALGRYVAREDDSFARESVDESLRRELQSKVQRQQAMREWEQKLAARQPEDEEAVLQLMGGNLQIGRLRRSLQRLLGH